VKKQQSHHRYPQTLVSFQHLEGGSYGTLTLIAIDRDTLEVRLGSDFVRMNADGASHVAEACARFAGGPPPEIVVEEVEEEERDVVVEVERAEPKLGRARRAPRRRPGA
jgi:hypothetical protein